MIQLGQYAELDYQNGNILLTGKLPVVALLQKVADGATNVLEKEIVLGAIAALNALSPVVAAIEPVAAPVAPVA